MKKHLLLTLSAAIATFVFNQSINAATFTSAAAGPNSWNAAASWTVVGVDADGIPDADDDVTIAGGHTITSAVTNYVQNLTITGTLSVSAGYMYTYGDLLNTGSQTGTAAALVKVAALID